MLAARLDRIEHQQDVQVAWMAEKGHEMTLQVQQTTSLTARVEHLETPGPRPGEPPGGERDPQPSPERLYALKTMPYQEYLQTPEWKARPARPQTRVVSVSGMQRQQEAIVRASSHLRAARMRRARGFICLVLILPRAS